MENPPKKKIQYNNVRTEKKSCHSLPHHPMMTKLTENGKLCLFLWTWSNQSLIGVELVIFIVAAAARHRCPWSGVTKYFYCRKIRKLRTTSISKWFAQFFVWSLKNKIWSICVSAFAQATSTLDKWSLDNLIRLPRSNHTNTFRS